METDDFCAVGFTFSFCLRAVHLFRFATSQHSGNDYNECKHETSKIEKLDYIAERNPSSARAAANEIKILHLFIDRTSANVN